jgi:hypothetical protein
MDSRLARPELAVFWKIIPVAVRGPLIFGGWPKLIFAAGAGRQKEQRQGGDAKKEFLGFHGCSLSSMVVCEQAPQE